MRILLNTTKIGLKRRLTVVAVTTAEAKVRFEPEDAEATEITNAGLSEHG